MLKVRLQGTTYDIKWFVKLLSRDERFMISEPSECDEELYRKIRNY